MKQYNKPDLFKSEVSFWACGTNQGGGCGAQNGIMPNPTVSDVNSPNDSGRGNGCDVGDSSETFLIKTTQLDRQIDNYLNAM